MLPAAEPETIVKIDTPAGPVVARARISNGRVKSVYSIIESRFSGWISGTTSFGPHPAVIPQVEGTAYITGSHEFLIDPEDTLRKGFILH
jgi:proline racemase